MKSISIAAGAALLFLICGVGQAQAAPEDCGPEQGGVVQWGGIGPCGTAGQAAIAVYENCVDSNTNQACYIAWDEMYNVVYTGPAAPVPGYCYAEDGVWYGNDIYSDTCN